MQEVLADRPRRLEDEPVLRRERIDADEAHDLLELGLSLEKLHRLDRLSVHEVLGDVVAAR